MEADLGQQNTGLASAWRKAAIRVDWRRIVDTATLQEYARKEEEEDCDEAQLQSANKNTQIVGSYSACEQKSKLCVRMRVCCI